MSLTLPADAAAAIEQEGLDHVYVYFEEPDTTMISRKRCDGGIYTTHHSDPVNRDVFWGGVSIRSRAGEMLSAWRGRDFPGRAVRLYEGDSMQVTINLEVAIVPPKRRRWWRT